MSESPPRMSIAMPVRNGAAHLEAALDSLLAQSTKDFELLVSDNASTDATPEILAEYARRDPRVRTLRQTQPLPVVAHFNSLVQCTRGEYFMWAADDDLWDPRFLEQLSGLLDTNPGAVMAFCALDNVRPDDADAVVRRISPRPLLDSTDAVTRMRAFLIDDESAGKANLIYGLMRRRELALAGGMIDWSTSRWGCDMLTVFRLLARGHVAWADGTLFRKRLANRELPASGDVAVPVPLRLIPAWHGYLLGYLRVIASCHHLDARARTQLASAAVGKLARGDRAALRRIGRRVRALS